MHPFSIGVNCHMPSAFFTLQINLIYLVVRVIISSLNKYVNVFLKWITIVSSGRIFYLKYIMLSGYEIIDVYVIEFNKLAGNVIQ